MQGRITPEREAVRLHRQCPGDVNSAVSKTVSDKCWYRRYLRLDVSRRCVDRRIGDARVIRLAVDDQEGHAVGRQIRLIDVVPVIEDLSVVRPQVPRRGVTLE